MTLYPRERRILDLYDDGMEARRIAQTLGLPLKIVRSTIAHFNSPDRFDQMSRTGTIALAKAIAQTGKAWA